MRREVAALAEAVRELSLEIAPSDDGVDTVKIRCPKAEFPIRLARLQRMLEALDAASASASDVAPPSENAAMRMALDAVFRWMRSKGMDVSEPHAAVAAVLRGTETSGGTRSAPKPTPRFAVDQMGKSHKRRPKPLLNLGPEHGEKVTLYSLRQKNLRANTVLTTLGAAAPR